MKNLFWAVRVFLKEQLSKHTVVRSFCKRCGGCVVDFHVDDPLWKIVEENGYSTLCYNCFCDVLDSYNIGGVNVIRKNRRDIVDFLQTFDAYSWEHRAILLAAQDPGGVIQWQHGANTFIQVFWYKREVQIKFFISPEPDKLDVWFDYIGSIDDNGDLGVLQASLIVSEETATIRLEDPGTDIEVTCSFNPFFSWVR